MQQGQRQLQGGLAAELNDHALRTLSLDDIEHILQRQRLEIEAVTGVVVRRDSLGIAVHHHRGKAAVLGRERGVTAAVIELDSLTDAVGTAPKDHHFAAIVRLNFAGGGEGFEGTISAEAPNRPLIGGVVIRGAGGELGGTGVHRLEHRRHTELGAVIPHAEFIAAGGPGDLTIGVAELLELQQR